MIRVDVWAAMVYGVTRLRIESCIGGNADGSHVVRWF